VIEFNHIIALIGDKFGVFDVPCPACGPSRRSPANRTRHVLRVWRTEHVFASYRCARCELSGYARAAGTASGTSRQREVVQVATNDEAERTKRALAIWDEARPIAGTLAEVYLAGRGVPYSGNALRWHPNCPFGKGTRYGCLVALVRNIVSKKPQAIHRTALDSDGNKLDRKMMGPTAGGIVKLTDDADVTLAVAIAEGIESALSIRNLPDLVAMPVWACLSAATLRTFPVLDGIETLWIGVDHDPTGIRAARDCAKRWNEGGREVIMLAPEANSADLNDLRARHVQG